MTTDWLPLFVAVPEQTQLEPPSVKKTLPVVATTLAGYVVEPPGFALGATTCGWPCATGAEDACAVDGAFAGTASRIRLAVQ